VDRTYWEHRPSRRSDEPTAQASLPSQENPTLEENFRAIANWERDSLHRRSKVEQLSDWITTVAARGSVLIGHVLLFAGWIAANVNAIPGVRPFDPFPFPFLTMVVSLEAIFLSLFVLASQNRLSQQSDKRAHLDLQIDLLAEREMTAVLQLLQDIARHLGAPVSVTAAQIRDLARKTDLHALTTKVEELPEEERKDAPLASGQNAT
jgi:uncharacterized membrane protein